jgi:preprotein translocase SecE subunit
VARSRTRTVEKTENHSVQKAEGPATEQPVRKDRPTPSARDIKPRGTGSTGLVNRIPIVRGIVAYFRGVWTELNKVTWPTREETTRLTAVVLGVTISFAVALGALDAFFSWWFRQAFHADSENIFLIVAAGVAAISSGVYYAFRRYV